MTLKRKITECWPTQGNKERIHVYSQDSLKLKLSSSLMPQSVKDPALSLCRGSGSIPELETSACHGHGQKNVSSTRSRMWTRDFLCLEVSAVAGRPPVSSTFSDTISHHSSSWSFLTILTTLWNWTIWEWVPSSGLCTGSFPCRGHTPPYSLQSPTQFSVRSLFKCPLVVRSS